MGKVAVTPLVLTMRTRLSLLIYGLVLLLQYGLFLPAAHAGDGSAQVSYELGAEKHQDCASHSLESATLIPEFDNGRIIGFLLKDFEAHSAWSRRGFKKGDLILEVDGTPAIDPFAGLLVGSAVCKNKGSITVKRKSKVVFLNPRSSRKPSH